MIAEKKRNKQYASAPGLIRTEFGEHRYLKNTKKADKAAYKAAKAVRKAEKWTQRMENAFANYDTDKLSKMSIAEGAQFVKENT